MLKVFGPNGAHFTSSGSEPVQWSDFTWIDCYQPTKEDELMLETALGIEIPTREEMLEIEVSNRLYEEGAVFTMTSTLVAKADSNAPEAGPVTFILTPNHLITVRYNEYMAFRTFESEFEKNPQNFSTGNKVFAGLVDKIVERLADVLEKVGFEAEAISKDLFTRQLNLKTKVKSPYSNFNNIRPRALLMRLGNVGNLDAKVREALLSLQRMLSFLNDTRTSSFAHESKTLLHANRNDIQSLSEHSYFLADKLTFLLDATLGLINIEQNDIIQVFSIAAVMFMPPTLIASMYGMNFRHMPELEWQYGYLFALGAIFLSALVPFFFFKRKGWL